MNLLKSSFFNGIAVAIRMATLLAINKVLAVYVGPTGYAVIGQLQNIISSVLTLSNGGLSSGVVKYTAQYSEDKNSRLKIWRTATGISLILTVIISSALICYSNRISVIYLKSDSYESILIYFAILLFLVVFNSICISIINGKRETKDYVLINVFSSIFTLFYTVTLVYLFGLYGALLALVSNQAVVFFLTFYIGIKKKHFDLFSLFGKIDFKSLIKLSKFSTMILIPSILWPICYTYVRQTLTSELGQEYAGNWDAMWKLSNVYLTFLTTVLGVYFLPKFSALKTSESVKNEILRGYRLIIPMGVLLCYFVYSCKKYIVELLFTSQFDLMLILFKWQILGDFLKIISWVISYAILAKSKVRLFLVLELIFVFLFAILCKFFIDVMGFEGVAFAHFINNALILFVTIIIFFKSSFDERDVI